MTRRTRNSKFKPWRCGVEHLTSQTHYLILHEWKDASVSLTSEDGAGVTNQVETIVGRFSLSSCDVFTSTISQLASALSFSEFSYDNSTIQFPVSESQLNPPSYKSMDSKTGFKDGGIYMLD